MYEEIDEPIDVVAEFTFHPERSVGQVRPLSFVWRRRDYVIAEITYIWQAKEGDTKLFYFAAPNGGNTYELCYNTKALEWRLAKIHID
jgi:hypothetical protein